MHPANTRATRRKFGAAVGFDRRRHATAADCAELEKRGKLAAMGAKCIGIAGWSVPEAHRGLTPGHGSHLERYACCFTAVEINSSFHRPHRAGTYERWAATVPTNFLFSVKAPREITHDSALRGCREEIARFSDEVAALGAKLSIILVQLPPSLEYEPRVAREFFARLRGSIPAHIVCEPRHPSWFDDRVADRMARWGVTRVAVDPVSDPRAAFPAGDSAVVYFRLHGSPRIYHSSYDARFLERLHALTAEHFHAGRAVWCIFDNTASGAAWNNALELRSLERAKPERNSRVPHLASEPVSMQTAVGLFVS